MEKNTPKKVYGAQSLDNNSTCRLCKSVGDPAHRYNLYSKTNSEILSSAEHIYGEVLPNKPELPKLICTPCKRRVRNFVAFRKNYCRNAIYLDQVQKVKQGLTWFDVAPIKMLKNTRISIKCAISKSEATS